MENDLHLHYDLAGIAHTMRMPKLLSLSQNISDTEPIPYVPLPASGNMYWFSSNQTSGHERGFDICFARLFFLGYDIYPSQEKSSIPEMLLSSDISDVFTKPLKLARGDNLFTKEFANLLHALQAVQFYNWKQSVLQHSAVKGDDTNSVVALSQAQKDEVAVVRQALLSRMQLDEKMLCYDKTEQLHFDWACFSEAVGWCQLYMLNLHKQLLMHLPLWKDHGFLFSVASPVTEE